MCIWEPEAKKKAESIESTGWNWEIRHDVSGGWKATVRHPESEYPTGEVFALTACEAIERALVWIRAVTTAIDWDRRPHV